MNSDDKKFLEDFYYVNAIKRSLNDGNCAYYDKLLLHKPNPYYYDTFQIGSTKFTFYKHCPINIRGNVITCAKEGLVLDDCICSVDMSYNSITDISPFRLLETDNKKLVPLKINTHIEKQKKRKNKVIVEFL